MGTTRYNQDSTTFPVCAALCSWSELLAILEDSALIIRALRSVLQLNLSNVSLQRNYWYEAVLLISEKQPVYIEVLQYDGK